MKCQKISSNRKTSNKRAKTKQAKESRRDRTRHRGAQLRLRVSGKISSIMLALVIILKVRQELVLCLKGRTIHRSVQWACMLNNFREHLSHFLRQGMSALGSIEFYQRLFTMTGRMSPINSSLGSQSLTKVMSHLSSLDGFHRNTSLACSTNL